MLLTIEEGREALRLDGADNDTVIQPLIDAIGPYLLISTGHDWVTDTTIHPLAKSVAVFLLQEWYGANADSKTISAGATTRQQKAIDSLLISLTALGRTLNSGT